jgi:hypothetical protein
METYINNDDLITKLVARGYDKGIVIEFIDRYTAIGGMVYTYVEDYQWMLDGHIMMTQVLSQRPAGL